MLGAVPAVFTPGPPPAHMSSPGRPVARRAPPPALPAAEAQPSRGDAGTGRSGADQGQRVREPPLAPVRPPGRAAEAPDGVGSAVGGMAEPVQTGSSPVTDAEDTVQACAPPHPAGLPAIEPPQAAAVSETSDCLKDAAEPQALPPQQRQQAAFDPRASAVPLGQAAMRTKQAASTASQMSDARPRLQAAAGIARSGSLHAPLLPVRPDPGRQASGSDARKSPEPDPTVRKPAAAAPAMEAMAVSREQSTGVRAHELSEQAAARASTEAAKSADDAVQLVSGLPACVQQPASPCAEAPANAITPAQGADDQPEAAEAANAPAALPTAVPQPAVSDAAAVGGPSGGSPPSDGSGMAACSQHELGDISGDARLHDAPRAVQRDDRSAAAKRHREVAAFDGTPSPAEEQPSKRQDAAAASSSGGAAIDVAAAMSVLLQVSLLVLESSMRCCVLTTPTPACSTCRRSVRRIAQI